MNPKNLKIGTQLYIGLGSVLLFVIVLGVMAWTGAGLLWEETKGIYEHPLTVRRALYDIRADVLAIRYEMFNLYLEENEQKRAEILKNIAIRESDAHRQFDIVSDSYLGPPGDVIQAMQSLLHWRIAREEAVRLLREGKREEALRQVRRDDPEADVSVLLHDIQTISDFAKHRGDRFYLDAAKLHELLSEEFIVVFGAILLMTLCVAYWLLRRIKDPLRELSRLARELRQGNLRARSDITTSNEFGELADGLNRMADAIQGEVRISESVASLTGVMLREEELHPFFRELLQALLGHTGSQVGAAYLLNAGKTEFELCESIGLAAGCRATFSATEAEGEFGLALATQQIQRIADIPADTRFLFLTMSGDFIPREIITIPIVANGEVAAVISLASVSGYSTQAIRLVNEVRGVLIARLNGVLAFRQLRELSGRLEYQNRELEAQAQELATQSDELVEQNAELEMQKRQLDEANRLKSAFLSNMSHELRTPLNSVIALSGVLSRRLVGQIAAEEAGYLEIIQRNGNHLLELINDILDLSRLEAGRDEIELVSFPLGTLVGEIVAMLEPQAREKQVALVNQVGGDLPLLESDPGKCRHILQNLLDNAVKFTDAGSVTISARLEGDALCVDVRDTGIGIAAAMVPYIFDEFRQGDGSTSRKYGGTGLGLAIARKYARLLQGDIAVDSIPGEGSVFTLQLPLKVAPSATSAFVATPTAYASARSGAEATLPTVSGHGKRILLVEDNEAAIIQVSDMLAEQGYQTEVARNGREALEHIERSLPDAMILDLMMPEADGFQVLKAVRGMKTAARLPVLILTAKHVTKDELSFLKGNNVRQLIQKGNVSRGELLDAVGRMVARPRRKPPASRGARPGKG